MSTNLINCVENLIGADRQLDLEIWNTIFPEDANPVQPVRSFTGSIDAAVTLIPEGWHWRLDQGRNAGAALYRDGFPQHFSVAETPALALCSVALRAHAAALSSEDRTT